MKEISIEDLAYFIKQAKEDKQPQPIFFLGAGASVSGNIPLAYQIVEKILTDYGDNPLIKKLKDEEKTYDKLMECLSPHRRNELLKNYIDAAKINVTHIYLAQLLKNGYADYILTVNFDNLMLRALALYNEFPSTYDMAILKDLTTTTFKEKSVVYLHGQHHGLWLLNTKDEMEKVKATVPRIFDSIKNERPWIFIGYSGNDPIFEHVKNLGRFDNGLYWVGYNDSEPNSQVKDFLTTPNTNAFYIKGYDADAFMLKLNEELELPQPKILNKPFSALKATLNEINDINDEDHFKGVKERLEISKKNVIKSINTFELGQKDSITDTEIEIDNLKKEIIDLMISEEYDENIISELEIKVKQFNDAELNNSLYNLYFNWGYYLGELTKSKLGKEKELFLVKTIEKYKKATEIKADDHHAFNNWGNALCDLAKIKKVQETETLYNQAFEKYQKAIDIQPNEHQIFNNWGNGLVNLAVTKKELEIEIFLKEAIKKYQKAIKINPSNNEYYNNYGNALGYLANTKKGQEAEKLYLESFKQFKKSISIDNNDFLPIYNWGLYLGNLGRSKQGQEADKLYKKAFEKYRKAIEIKPDLHEAFYEWGRNLAFLAQKGQEKKAEILLQQAFEKYQKSAEFGGKVYNLACMFALKNNKDEALHYLDLTLKNQEEPTSFILKDPDWKDYLEDPDFLAIIEKYKSPSS